MQLFLYDYMNDNKNQSDVDGVHIGQHDMKADLCRRLLGPHKIMGLSAQTKEQAIKAQEDGADYLGTGAVFPTM